MQARYRAKLNGHDIVVFTTNVTYGAGVKTIDFIVEGIDKAKAAMIITTKAQVISNDLSENFRSGVTIMPAKGVYSDTNTSVIYFVVNRFQIAKMKNIVRKHDINAFVSITEVSETLGAEKNNA